MWRKAGWVVSILVMLGTGGVGVYDGLTEWGQGQGLAQKSVTAAVLLYGLLGLAAAVGTLLRRAWARPLAIGWAVCATYAASVAVLAFDNASVSAAFPAFAGAAIVSALVVLGAGLLAPASSRRPVSPNSSTTPAPDLDHTQRPA